MLPERKDRVLRVETRLTSQPNVLFVPPGAIPLFPVPSANESATLPTIADTPSPTPPLPSHQNPVRRRPSLALASPAHRTCAASGISLSNVDAGTAAPTATPVSTVMALTRGPAAPGGPPSGRPQSQGSPLPLPLPLFCPHPRVQPLSLLPRSLYPQALFRYLYH